MMVNLSFSFFSLSVAIVMAALAGPQWILTEEKMPNINYNGTANYDVKDDGVFITKYSKSSLWILCSTQGKIRGKNNKKNYILKQLLLIILNMKYGRKHHLQSSRAIESRHLITKMKTMITKRRCL